MPQLPEFRMPTGKWRVTGVLLIVCAVAFAATSDWLWVAFCVVALGLLGFSGGVKGDEPADPDADGATGRRRRSDRTD